MDQIQTTRNEFPVDFLKIINSITKLQKEPVIVYKDPTLMRATKETKLRENERKAREER